MSYILSRPWIRSFPSTKNPNEKFWVARVDVTEGDFTFSFQFSKVDSATNWIIKTPIKIEQSIRTKLLADAQAFIKQTRAKNRPISNKPTITNKEVSKEENCM
jgi:hypothetical protein